MIVYFEGIHDTADDTSYPHDLRLDLRRGGPVVRLLSRRAEQPDVGVLVLSTSQR